jgi:stage V sporulation protein G
LGCLLVPAIAPVTSTTIRGRRTVEVTEVRIRLRNEEKLKAFASITLDNCFVVRGLKVINGTHGYFVSMPSRKRSDGTYQDLAHPISSEMRMVIESRVLDAFEQELAVAASDGDVEVSGPHGGPAAAGQGGGGRRPEERQEEA